MRAFIWSVHVASQQGAHPQQAFIWSVHVASQQGANAQQDIIAHDEVQRFKCFHSLKRLPSA
eukprot:1159097-Pelagomonas_calceolata.AAC.8